MNQINQNQSNNKNYQTNNLRQRRCSNPQKHNEQHEQTGVLKYGQQLYFFTPTKHYLFARGFMNIKTYLVKEKSPECIFVLQQKRKKYLTLKNTINNNNSNQKINIAQRHTSISSNSIINSDHNINNKEKQKDNEKHQDSRSIIFGTELLIKHQFSGNYLAVNLSKSNSSSNQPELILKKQEDESCYFELIPQRSFQQNGQSISLNSFFSIQASQSSYKQYCISSSLKEETQFNFQRLSIDIKKSLQNPRKTEISNSHQFIKRHQSITGNSSLGFNGTHFSAKNIQLYSNENRYSDVVNFGHAQNTNINASSILQLQEKQNQNQIDFEDILKNNNDNGQLDYLQQKEKEKERQESPNNRLSLSQSKSSLFYQDAINKNSIFPHLTIFKNDNRKSFHHQCKIDVEQNSIWKIQLKFKQKTNYFEDGDYIEFVYSNRNQGVMSLDIQRLPFQIKYQKNKGDEEDYYNAIFKVEVEEVQEQIQLAKQKQRKKSQQHQPSLQKLKKQQRLQNKTSARHKMYLKHLLTDQYFPLNKNNERTQFQIFLLCQKETNQLPVFEIRFDNKIFQPKKSDFINLNLPQNYRSDAFWINKVQKYGINEIISFQGVSQQVWIRYLKNYINAKGHNGQRILKQVQILKYIIEFIIPQLKKNESSQSITLRKECYLLLFKACLFNNSVKKYLIDKHINEILSEKKKQLIVDLIIELLQVGDGVIENKITSQIIAKVIKDFITNNQYSISYLRLFRIFCGSDQQPSVANQNLIFNYFFQNENENQNKNKNGYMTQSTLKIVKNQSLKIPNRFKFNIKIVGQQVTFLCDQNQIQIQDLTDDRLKPQSEKQNSMSQYLRQYFYLLSDTMKGENHYNIQIFQKQYKRDILINLLIEKKKQFLLGPLLSLILNAYLSSQNKFKFYIFYKQYPKIYHKGKLMLGACQKHHEKLIGFIKKALIEMYKKQNLKRQIFTSTTFKHFLSLIKLSIQNGYWSKEEEVQDVIQWIQGIFLIQEERCQQHQRYSEKLQIRNLLISKTTAVEIYILQVDLQINLCISELIEYPVQSRTQIMHKIQQFYRRSQTWNITKTIFQICSTSNNQLMKKSLLLFKKLYHIKSIITEEYVHARKQINNSETELIDKIRFIIQNDLKFAENKQKQAICQKYVQACFGISGDKYQWRDILQEGKNFQYKFKYKKPNEQFQNLAFKLGIHTNIIYSLNVYISLRKKQQKLIQYQNLYSQLFLLFILIKDNQILKNQISEYRKLFIALLNDQHLYLISCDILIEVYRSNRRLIVSNTEELEKICILTSEWLKKETFRTMNMMNQSKKERNNFRMSEERSFNEIQPSFNKINSIESNYNEITSSKFQRKKSLISKQANLLEFRKIQQNNQVSLKDCKMMQLLLMFAKYDNKKLQRNQKIIQKYMFNTDIINLLHLKVHSSNQNYSCIFKILIYNLMLSLEKVPQVYGFELIQNAQFNKIIMHIGKSNWELKAVIFKMLQKKINHFSQDELKLLTRHIRYDLNVICQILHQAKWQQDQPKFDQSQTKQIQAFLNCTPYIVKICDRILISIKIMQISEDCEELLSKLIRIIQRLFLLRKIFQVSLIQDVQNLVINIDKNKFKNSKDINLNKVNIDSLFKIKISDFTLDDIRVQQYAHTPLVVQIADKQHITLRQQVRYFKKNNLNLNNSNESIEMISNFQQLNLAQKIISFSKQQKSLSENSQFLVFSTKKETLRKFILNLISVNSSDSNVLSDQLKTFFLTYLSHSFNINNQEKQDNDNDKEKDDDVNNEENIKEMQNLLIEYEIPKVICSILEEGFKYRYTLFGNMFQLGNRLLQGGNTQGQNQFIKIFKNDHKNLIFQNISKMIFDLLQTLNFYFTANNKLKEQYQSQIHENQMAISERHEASSLLCHVFRFMQLLCENNNQQMKDYIFSQSDQNSKIKYLSVNFVQIGIEMFHSLIQIIIQNINKLTQSRNQQLGEEIKNNLFKIPNSILDFLIQVCQIPAFQNQIYLCKTDFLDNINGLMKLSELNTKFQNLKNQNVLLNSNSSSQIKNKMLMMTSSSSSSNKKFVQNIFLIPNQRSQKGVEQNIVFVYQRKLIVLFRSLLQQENLQIIDIMGKKLGMRQFQYFINQSLYHGGLEDTQILKNMLKQNKLNHYLENIVDVLIVKKSLKIQEDLKFDKAKSEIIEVLEHRIQTINVNFQDANITVYFPFHPLFQLLSDKTKNFFIDKSISFKSRNQKMRDFIVSRYVIYQDIENQKNAVNKIMNDKSMGRLYNFIIGLSYLIIMLLILFYSVSKSGTVLDMLQKQIINGISFMQLIVTLMYFILWGINIAPLTKQKLKTKKIFLNKSSQTGNNRKKRQKSDKKQKNSHNILEKILPNLKIKDNLIFLKQIYIEESSSFHVLLLLFVSLFAFFFEVRVYSFTLLFFFAKIQLLESILKAIRLTWKQLLIVCFLAVVFSFIFGFLTINNYIGPLYENQEIDIDINRMNQHCNSIISCIHSLYTQKIIGESVNQQGDENQFLSDLVYWGFFQILLANIIAAIIIDKFAQQRNAKEKIQNEKHNRCYICSAQKSSIQRKGIDFEQHISKTHYLWNYFYYMYSLERLKDSTQFTGIQYWIEHQIKNCKIQWIPLDESKRQREQYSYYGTKQSKRGNNFSTGGTTTSHRHASLRQNVGTQQN